LRTRHQGYRDARLAGQKIKEHIGDKPLFIYTSPYLRTKQTLAGAPPLFLNRCLP
jgi:phosphohistidine phosphatase SixA